MNDTLIKMVASQMGIPPDVVEELKASKPKLIRADFGRNGIEGLATLTVQVTHPNGSFPVVISLPIEQLRRFPAIYYQAAQLDETL